MLRKSAPANAAPADVCLILEGTYPYTLGGVSGWTHELIKMQRHLRFALVAIIGADAPAHMHYQLPENVVSLQTIRLQRLPEGAPRLGRVQESILFSRLEKPLLHLQSKADLKDLALIVRALLPHRRRLGRKILLDSPAAWELIVSMYRQTMPGVSFLDYFWSWRGLFGGLLSVLLSPLPPANLYHALCTGYAGLLLARAHLETGRPCAVTEHGIYTNERRIEIVSADWLDDPHGFNLAVDTSGKDRELKDFWMDTFTNYSRLCYEACSRIVTLYEGNQEFQRMDGAQDRRLQVIPNGIDYERFEAIATRPHPPTVSLIGRVVPIKDIKSYIKAVHILKRALPDVRAYMLGPTEEDPVYAAECLELVAHLGLQDTLVFTGKVAIEDYLGITDVLVLTSLSEAQPLVILEAGAAGIPTVATDVGACREMILGNAREHEDGKGLGAGGAVVPLSNPQAVAHAMLQLLTQPEYYRQCSRAIRARVRRFYSKEEQRKAYARLYGTLMEAEGAAEKKAA